MAVFILLPSISIVCASEFADLCEIIDWNFSGLTIISFSLSNQKLLVNLFLKLLVVLLFLLKLKK